MAVVSKSDTDFAGGVDSPSSTTTRMRFKYAFVRSSNAAIQVDPKHWRGSDIQPAEIEVVDMEGFLRKTAPGVDTSKLAYHFSELENSFLQATTRGQTIATTPDKEPEPLLSSLSPDETCDILNKFVVAMPHVQKAIARGARWDIGRKL